MPDALVLLAHGSRDPRWAEPFRAIEARVAEALPHVPVRLAFLEGTTPDLASAVAELTGTGARHVLVLPLLLGQGTHLREQVPQRVHAVAQSHPGVALHLSDSLGEAEAVLGAIVAWCVAAARG